MSTPPASPIPSPICSIMVIPTVMLLDVVAFVAANININSSDLGETIGVLKINASCQY